MKFQFSRQICENSQIFKIPPTEAEWFHANRQSDMTKLTVTFRNFAKSHKNRTSITMIQIGIFDPTSEGILKWILKKEGKDRVHLGQVRNKCRSPVYVYALLNHHIP
jgi:hypothetical protein